MPWSAVRLPRRWRRLPAGPPGVGWGWGWVSGEDFDEGDVVVAAQGCHAFDCGGAKASFVGADGGCGELSAGQAGQVVEGQAELLAGGS